MALSSGGLRPNDSHRLRNMIMSNLSTAVLVTELSPQRRLDHRSSNTDMNDAAQSLTRFKVNEGRKNLYSFLYLVETSTKLLDFLTDSLTSPAFGRRLSSTRWPARTVRSSRQVSDLNPFADWTRNFTGFFTAGRYLGTRYLPAEGE